MAAENSIEEEKIPEAILVANLSGAEPKTSRESEKEGIELKDKKPSSFKDKPTSLTDRYDEKESSLGITDVLKEGLTLGKKTSKLDKAFSLIQNNSITLRNLVVAAATYGLERLLNSQVFNCPENSYQQYGFAFLFGPVVILFCTNLLVIGEIWRLSSRMYVKRYRRRGDCIARVLPSLLKACVGPAVWLIVAFLEEDYYLCAKLGPVPRNQNGENEQEIFERKQKVEECKGESQMWAWSVLVALVILGTAVIVWKYCYLKDNLLMDNLYAYERREALSAMRAFTERMGGSFKDAGLDNDPSTAEYGGGEEKVTLYDNGVPEMIGKKTVEKLFEGYADDQWTDGDEWHYIRAYKAFKEMYPRISTGSPLDPWRLVRGDVHETRTQKTCRLKCLPTCVEMESSWHELEPLHLEAVTPKNERASRSDEARESSV